MRTPHPDDWLPFALCREEGHPSWWDDRLDAPDGEEESREERDRRHEKAKTVCRRCPVQDECAVNTDLERDEGVRFGVLLAELKTHKRHKERQRHSRTLEIGGDDDDRRRTA